MEDKSSEKQHLPSARKISQLKKRGIVLRSRDLVAAISFSIFFCIIFTFGHLFFYKLNSSFRMIPEMMKLISNDKITLIQVIRYYFFSNMLLFFIVPVSVLVATIFTPALFGGWNLSFESVRFDLNRLNIISNLSRIFNVFRAFKEILKSLLKTVVIFFAVYVFFRTYCAQIFSYEPESIFAGAYLFKQVFMRYFSVMLMIFIVLAAVDMFITQREFMNQHKMTAKELEDEHRESEGSPETRRRVRSVRFAIYRQRLASVVPKANVIITNPSHFAVALRYRSDKDLAPVLLAKGKDVIAAEIRRIGLSCYIPIYSAPTVARAIYYTTKVGKQIHPDLYMPVAIILSYLRQLDQWRAGQGQLPELVTEFDLPEKYRFKQ